MAYQCELGNGQHLFLDQSGTQTLVMLSSSGGGQQQQATQSIQTGSWTTDPEVFRVANGVIVKLKTAQGEYFVQIQGSSIGVLSSVPALDNAQQIQMQQLDSPSQMPPMMSPIEPMQPMQPMKPMQMGNMQMSLKPMAMKMGDMSMQMGVPTAPPAPPATRQFCSQCGVAVQSADRFCSSCGHQLDT
ncbi:MAG: zinc ribbon domain-containing protein [Drouetiella hepatica Uher 2000/2452]|jgi:hypothetical protein|uniref:Zinc ribbon domain-containing protein n=1 Tax=Drouetiella hepatica Uher 2000/2452 TaxID=904376 RepID=A0A951QGI1_9CYAN|nr:zinc ribbon domain-containing protein [Drouetiella hepatica Uher 2000/2452]